MEKQKKEEATTATATATIEVSIKSLQSDLTDLKQLYDNEVKQNKILTKKNHELSADLIIKQKFIDEKFEESKKEIEVLNLRIQEQKIEIEILIAKLTCTDDLVRDFREIIYKMIK